MAPLVYLSFRKVLLIYVVLFLHASAALILCAFSETDKELIQSRKQILGRRRMLADFEEEIEAVIEEKQKPKKKSFSTTATTTTSSSSNKNQTKLSKPNLSTKNQTKLIKTSSTKNQTKPLKTTNSTKTIVSKSELKKLNSTSQLIKKLNSTSKPSNSIKTKLSDPLIKPTSSPSKNNITKPTSSPSKNNITKPTSTHQNTNTKPLIKTQKKTTKQTQPSWIDQDDDDDQDLVSEFRDLPIKFQQTLLPDLERISTTSKAYINKYNKELTKKYFNPIVGNRYASTIASIVSFAFILVPLLLVSLVFNRFKAYFSLQKLVIFVQVYLSIYFTILCLSSIVTGVEPLKFLYATSRSTYICLQVLQTLGYILYLLMLLMYLVLVFSTDCGLGTRLLGLAQTILGFAVGLHYYVAVFHRVVLRQPPKTNWKIHAVYATCFLVICLFNRADRRKKAYLVDDGEEGKKS